MRCLAFTILISALPLLAGNSKKDPAEIGNRSVASGVNRYSLASEMALGRQLAAEVEKQATMVDDPIVSEYLNRLGQNLARNSDVTIPVTFRMIESSEINAFTLPGGYIFVSTGLLMMGDNEAELASVISHELGHAAARHATRLATRDDMISAARVPGTILLGGWGGLLWDQATKVGSPMLALHFSRDFEDEADLLGIQYLWKAGYDPTASIDMFERIESIEKSTPGSVSKIFRTHPLTADRIERTQKNISEMLPQQDQYVLNTSEYEDIRTRLGNLIERHKK